MVEGNAEESEVVHNTHGVEGNISSLERPSAGDQEWQVTLEDLVEYCPNEH